MLFYFMNYLVYLKKNWRLSWVSYCKILLIIQLEQWTTHIKMYIIRKYTFIHKFLFSQRNSVKKEQHALGMFVTINIIGYSVLFCYWVSYYIITYHHEKFSKQWNNDLPHTKVINNSFICWLSHCDYLLFILFICIRNN